ncbi:MAG: recombinase family protein [Myxococcota bacterium]|nr:recombinase family protein [Myxococcota bacterium]
MHPAIKTGPVAIYARFSSSLQNERSIEDQVRRCREFIAANGGNPDKAEVFPDYAISGSSLDRRGLEAMMAGVEAGYIKAIVVEDMSRVSRDIADSATLFKKLQFYQVPLLGVADGIDTSARGAKLSYTVKSLVADMYLEDLRDKTLRGLEGRALAGYATGNVPYGFHTVPVVDTFGKSIGNKIEVHEGESKILIRIFNEFSEGRSPASIARDLNKDGVPSPRVGQRHKAFGWSGSTVRVMLRNERYIGVWRFKEREWVKVPGTNRRQPRARNASEVMVMQKPELRIIKQKVWDFTQARVAAIYARYTKKAGEQKKASGVPRARANYLLSGLLVCKECGSSLTLSAGTNAAYYRCQTNRKQGTCSSRISVREDVARARILEAFETWLSSEEGVQRIRKNIAQQLGEHSRNLEKQLDERRDRLHRTELKIRGLIDFIATGDKSPYVISTMRDLEAYARTEKSEIASLTEEAREPIYLPSLDELNAMTTNMQMCMMADIERGREMLRRYLGEGIIKCGVDAQGAYADCELGAHILLAEAEARTKSTKDPENYKTPGAGSGSKDSAVFASSSGGRI